VPELKCLESHIACGQPVLADEALGEHAAARHAVEEAADERFDRALEEAGGHHGDQRALGGEAFGVERPELIQAPVSRPMCLVASRVEHEGRLIEEPVLDATALPAVAGKATYCRGQPGRQLQRVLAEPRRQFPGLGQAPFGAGQAEHLLRQALQDHL